MKIIEESCKAAIKKSESSIEFLQNVIEKH